MEEISLNTKQIENIASHILISDVLEYIETHKKEYELFLENERKEEENENRKFEKSEAMDKLEISNN